MALANTCAWICCTLPPSTLPPSWTRMSSACPWSNTALDKRQSKQAWKHTDTLATERTSHYAEDASGASRSSLPFREVPPAPPAGRPPHYARTLLAPTAASVSSVTRPSSSTPRPLALLWCAVLVPTSPSGAVGHKPCTYISDQDGSDGVVRACLQQPTPPHWP